MPELTRFAVMQHLGVLETAGLVLSRREGRSRLNYSNPVLIKDLFDEWVTPLASTAAEAAQHLRRYAETTAEVTTHMAEPENRFVRIEIETRIRAPKSLVFEALTSRMGEWWPHRFRPDGEVYHEARLGGTLGEKWPGGGGAIYGTITWYEIDARVSTTSVGLMGDCVATNTETVTEEDGLTAYRKSLHLWGDVPADLERVLREGAQKIAQDALVTYCEQRAGERS